MIHLDSVLQSGKQQGACYAATIIEIATAITKAANSTPASVSKGANVISFGTSKPIEVDMAARDKIRRAFDQALVHVNPQVDPTRCKLVFGGETVCQLTVAPAPYPRHRFEGELLLPAGIVKSDVKALRQKYQTGTGEKRKRKCARQVVDLLYQKSMVAALTMLVHTHDTIASPEELLAEERERAKVAKREASLLKAQQKESKKFAAVVGTAGKSNHRPSAAAPAPPPPPGWVVIPRGVRVNTTIAAFDKLYAYVALMTSATPGADDEGKKAIIGRVPVPSKLLSLLEENESLVEKHTTTSIDKKELSILDMGAWKRIQRDDNSKNSSGVRYFTNTEASEELQAALALPLVSQRIHFTSTKMFWVEDLHHVDKMDVEEEQEAGIVDSIGDVLGLVLIALTEQKTGIEGSGGLSAAAMRFSRQMGSATNVFFKKQKGGKQSSKPVVPKIDAATRHVDGEECEGLEFKYQIANASQQHGNNKNKLSTMTTERLRNVVAAMASGNGGVIMLGVSDDGTAAGHEPFDKNDANSPLRLTGFAPSMPKDTITTRTLPAPSGQKDSSDEQKPKLPANWWKGGGALMGAATAAAPAGGAKNTVTTKPKHITAIMVEAGTAPFYVSGKGQLPYVRTFASTVTMSTSLMVQRVADQFPQELLDDSMGAENNNNGDGEQGGVNAAGRLPPGAAEEAEGKTAVLHEALENAVAFVHGGGIGEGEALHHDDDEVASPAPHTAKRKRRD